MKKPGDPDYNPNTGPFWFTVALCAVMFVALVVMIAVYGR